jgi:hypothetical protein
MTPVTLAISGHSESQAAGRAADIEHAVAIGQATKSD